VLVERVAPRALLELEATVVPAGRVEALDRVDLDAARFEQVADGVDHAALLVVAGVTLLRREHEQRAAEMPVGEHEALAADRGSVDRGLASGHDHARSSTSSR